MARDPAARRTDQSQLPATGARLPAQTATGVAPLGVRLAADLNRRASIARELLTDQLAGNRTHTEVDMAARKTAKKVAKKSTKTVAKGKAASSKTAFGST